VSAFPFLAGLQEAVGPRRAGTAGEEKTLAWLEGRCQELGWQPERHPFRYIGSEWYQYGLFLLLLAAPIAAIWLPGWAGLILVALILSFFGNGRKRLELALARKPGTNLLAGLRRPFREYITDPQRPPALIYCAHYDTARCAPRWSQRLRGVLRFFLPLALVAFILYAGLEILSLTTRMLSQVSPWLTTTAAIVDEVANWGGLLALVMVTPLLLFLLASTASRLFTHQQDSPGADDNGSGVAVLLEVGQRLAENPPAGVEVFLAFWGAEELGLYGSRQFVREFQAQLPPERTALINVDCVGVGEYLSVYAGQGGQPRRPVDPRQMEQLETIAQKHDVPTIRTWESIITGGSSDHAEWVECGYRRTASLIREDYHPPSLPARILGFLLRLPYVTQLELKHIHSTADTLEVVHPDRLEATAAIAEEFGRKMAEEVSA
jgi:hypothetical protein